MKKIITVWISINLLVLNTLPSTAQGLIRDIKQVKRLKQVERGINGATKVVPLAEMTGRLGQFSIENKAGTSVLGVQLDRTIANSMRLPLTTDYTPLLGNTNPLLTQEQEILAVNSDKERAFLLRSVFVALALDGKVSKSGIKTAVDFYRTNLGKKSQDYTQTVADIASLGLLGSKEDGALILQIAQEAIGTPKEAVVTAAAARALLRLGAYKELEKLDDVSEIQPELWNGISIYAKQHNLPVHLLFIAERKPVNVAAAQANLAGLGPINSLIVNPSLDITRAYMNTGRLLQKIPSTYKEAAALSAKTPAQVLAAQRTSSHKLTAANETSTHRVAPAETAKQVEVPHLQTSVKNVAKESTTKADTQVAPANFHESISFLRKELTVASISIPVAAFCWYKFALNVTHAFPTFDAFISSFSAENTGALINSLLYQAGFVQGVSMPLHLLSERKIFNALMSSIGTGLKSTFFYATCLGISQLIIPGEMLTALPVLLLRAASVLIPFATIVETGDKLEEAEKEAKPSKH